MAADHSPQLSMLQQVMENKRGVQVIEFCRRPIVVRLGCLAFILALLRVISVQSFVHQPETFSNAVSSKAMSVFKTTEDRTLEDKLLDIDNSTLGFQKVFAIGLPERTDKRDTFSLIAQLTGFEFEWIDGVAGDALSSKAIPESFSRTRWAGDRKTIACWRAHMNIAQRMLNENIQTALILEDDADWDVFLRSQLKGYARGVNALEATARGEDKPAPPSTGSAFGDNWDLQWIGNCGTQSDEHLSSTYYITTEDPTAIPDALYQRDRDTPNFTPPALWESNYTRAIFPGTHCWCTYGYGLSLRGAKRSIYLQAVQDNADAIDQSFDKFCSDPQVDFDCHVVFPPLIGTHRPAGNPNKDSDRENQPAGEVRAVATTVNVVYSMILNAKRLLEGKRTAMSQWPGQTMVDELDIGTILPQGRQELISPDQFREKPWEPRFGGPRYRPPW